MTNADIAAGSTPQTVLLVNRKPWDGATLRKRSQRLIWVPATTAGVNMSGTGGGDAGADAKGSLILPAEGQPG